MTHDVQQPEGLIDEPRWPVGSGPYLFLIEASGSLEKRLLESWISRHRPQHVSADHARRGALPLTRRRPRQPGSDPRFEADLADGDPLLVPLRVIWLPSTERDGELRVGLTDLLSFGDPRDPGSVRQRFIHGILPGRIRIIMGEPARASEVRKRWEDPGGKGRARGLSLGEFTMLQGWLALERAERRFRGNKYKVPRFPREMLVAHHSFRQGVARLAEETGATYDHMMRRSKRYVREIAATHSPYVIDLVTGAFSWIISKAYFDLHYSGEELDRLAEIGARHPLVFLPSHKSHFDHLVLQFALHRNGLPPNHTAGGINMNFLAVGPILRRSGVFFIRRRFNDNEPYKFVLRQYIDYLLEKRFALEWYIEGGRSRTGKLRAPRLGLLAYVVDSFRRGSTDDVVLIPVSIAYDQIQEVGAHATEQTGGAKDAESLSWMVKTIRGLRHRYGAVHLRFGDPISLRAFLATHEDSADEPLEGHSSLVPKLAFRVSAGINDATPITPISLVTLALLTSGDRSLTVDETVEALVPFVDFVARRRLPVTDKLSLDDPAQVQAALDALTEHGILSRFQGTTATVYQIGPEQHLAAAFYRNTIIHHFVNAAITELALMHTRDSEASDLANDVLAEAVRLRDLLKFEFFFAPSDEFAAQIEKELDDHDGDWKRHLAARDVDAVLDHFRPFRSPAVLRPFLEAYQVMADIIANADGASDLDSDGLIDDALALGKQYHLQRRIRTAESVSNVLFATAAQLADNRELLHQRPETAGARNDFAAQLTDVVRRLGAIEVLAAARDAGLS